MEMKNGKKEATVTDQATQFESFNLIDESWIRILDGEGNVREVGLAEALKNAHEIRGLAGELATQDFAVLRVLISIVYRVLEVNPDNPVRSWYAAWQKGYFDVDAVDGYLGKWRDRFDLFDEDAPFLQTPDLETTNGQWKSLEVLVPDCPDEGAMFIRRDPALPIPPGEAARWLVHCMAFDISGIKSGAVGDPRVKGGKGYPIGIGWCGWLGGLYFEGETLFQTLMLNTVLANWPVGGTPAWEQDVPGPAERTSAEIGEMGPLTLFTWQQRRIRLHHDNGMVTKVRVCNGDPVDYLSQLGTETMSGWRYSVPQSMKAKADVYMPRGHTPDRAMWRGLDSLVPLQNPPTVKGRGNEPVKASDTAENVKWISSLVSKRSLPADFRLRLRGVGMEYGPQQSSFGRVFDDRLNFLAPLLEKGDRVQVAALVAVERADAAVQALGKFAANVEYAGSGDRGEAAESARTRAFAEIDPEFRSWLQDLTPGTVEPALEAWSRKVHQLVGRHAGMVIDAAPASAWRGRKQDSRVINIGQAEVWFRGELARAVPRPQIDGNVSDNDAKEEA